MKKLLAFIICLMATVCANAHNSHYPTYTVDDITYAMIGSWDGRSTCYWMVSKVHKPNDRTIVIPSKVPIIEEQRTEFSGEELNVVGIGEAAFSECSSLDSLIISDGIRIGDFKDTFKGCRPLEYLYYSNGGYMGLTNWGDGKSHSMTYTGLSCKTLETALGCCEKPFWDTIAMSLEKLIIRETDRVYTHMDICPYLKTIVCYATIPPFTYAARSPYTYTCAGATLCFESWQWSSITLYVPRESLEKYYYHKVWGEIDNIYAIEEMENVNSAATSINSITNNTIENNVWYSLDGKKVSNPTNGIYIKNGKKYFVK